ncbi:CLUMA_CG012900, isoform A [Gryllus bimaculatus]|nr:CLUMA_CG012900, isoform A [Gryllus bimaculatus]
MPFTGYVPGQRVQMLLEVDNKSSSQVTVKCNLVQKVLFTGTSNSGTKILEDRSIIETEQFGVVEKKGSKNFQSRLVIPPLPASFLVHCNCIDIRYSIEIVGAIPGMHIDATLEVPIVIGVIPLRNHFQSILATDMQVPSTSGATATYILPSAPPGYDYPELPPPSYEESLACKVDIHSDDDSKDLQGNTDFAPRYPMYRFQ